MLRSFLSMVFLVPLPALAAEESMSVDKLIEMIRGKNLNRIEQVLAELPNDMKTNYILMYQSRSLQDATPTSPRAIHFTPSARFVLTYNGGEPELAGATSLETVQYRDETRSFEFREIEFRPGEKPTVSKINPAKCLGCHQSSHRKDIDPRPNWEPYNVWPGAFGAIDGRLGEPPRGFMPVSERISSVLMRDHGDLLGEVFKEKERYAHFQKNVAPKHPRFRYLGKFIGRNSLDLTDAFGALNFRRVARLVVNEKEIVETYRPAIEYAKHCGSARKLMNLSAMSWNLAQPEANYHVVGAGHRSVSLLVSPIFEPLGVDTSDWSMDFRTGGKFAFIDRFGLAGSWDEGFFDAWRELMPDFGKLSEADCPKLEAEIEKKVHAFHSSEARKRLASRRPPVAEIAQRVVRRCASCHAVDDSKAIPRIPMHSESELRIALRRTGYNRGTLLDEILYRTGEVAKRGEQMPPRQGLDATEAQALASYLKSLAK